MRDEFMVKRNGRDFVLFAGLLEEAHHRGLHSIDTLLSQVPNEGNENVAIVFAKVTMGHDEEPSDRPYFTGYGDASPENVKDHTSKRLIAMAETRAKARALRDAVNVGATSLEELSDDKRPDVYDRVRESVSRLPSNNTSTSQGSWRGSKHKLSPRASEALDQAAASDDVHELRGTATEAPTPDPHKIRKVERAWIILKWEELTGSGEESLVAWIQGKWGKHLDNLTREEAKYVLAGLEMKLQEKEAALDADDESGLDQTSRTHVPEDEIEINEEDVEEIEELTRGNGGDSAPTGG